LAGLSDLQFALLMRDPISATILEQGLFTSTARMNGPAPEEYAGSQMQGLCDTAYRRGTNPRS
jgi:hypothetical protein